MFHLFQYFCNFHSKELICISNSINALVFPFKPPNSKYISTLYDMTFMSQKKCIQIGATVLLLIGRNVKRNLVSFDILIPVACIARHEFVYKVRRIEKFLFEITAMDSKKPSDFLNYCGNDITKLHQETEPGKKAHLMRRINMQMYAEACKQ